MRNLYKCAAAFSLALALASPAKGQLASGLPVLPLGYCQIASATLASAVGFSSCISASFTATCSGTTITASAVTGDISVGWPLSGTGVVAGTYVAALGTGTGGAGTYTASQACTSSGASLQAVGPPNGATLVLLGADAQSIRWRDDGGTPTTASGMLLIATQQPFLYNGTMSKMLFIDAVAGGLLNASFYKTSSP